MGNCNNAFYKAGIVTEKIYRAWISVWQNNSPQRYNYYKLRQMLE